MHRAHIALQDQRAALDQFAVEPRRQRVARAQRTGSLSGSSNTRRRVRLRASTTAMGQRSSRRCDGRPGMSSSHRGAHSRGPGRRGGIGAPCRSSHQVGRPGAVRVRHHRQALAVLQVEAVHVAHGRQGRHRSRAAGALGRATRLAVRGYPVATGRRNKRHRADGRVLQGHQGAVGAHLDAAPAVTGQRHAGRRRVAAVVVPQHGASASAHRQERPQVHVVVRRRRDVHHRHHRAVLELGQVRRHAQLAVQHGAGPRCPGAGRAGRPWSRGRPRRRCRCAAGCRTGPAVARRCAQVATCSTSRRGLRPLSACPSCRICAWSSTSNAACGWATGSASCFVSRMVVVALLHGRQRRVVARARRHSAQHSVAQIRHGGRKSSLVPAVCQLAPSQGYA